MAIDPVCKMEVEESKAAATSEYQGKKYYFCAIGCKKAFNQNPEKYLTGENLSRNMTNILATESTQGKSRHS